MRTRPALAAHVAFPSPLRPRLHQQHLRAIRVAAQSYRRELERENLHTTQHGRHSLQLLLEALGILEQEYAR